MVLFLAIHCVWDNWAIGSCVTQTELEDGTYCGPGTRTNTRVKLVEESNGGTCDGEYEAILECMDKECPGRCSLLKHDFSSFINVDIAPNIV